MKGASLEKARAAKGHALAIFERVAPVVGVGITQTNDGYALKINLRSRPANVAFPDTVDGVPIHIEVVGEIRKFADTSRDAGP